MENNHQEKLSLIQDLISLSKADGTVDYMEENFIKNIASSLGVSEKELEELKNNPIDFNPETNETARIIQFYRLLLLMGIDQNRTPEEINCCKQLALNMGLNPVAVNKTITQILNSETGMLPPDAVIKIFQVQHN
ncbi:MAG: TerB family tellurite resistance protein [Vicingaceae bacterium]